MAEKTNRNSYLNVQIGSNRGVHTKVIEAPGLWMSSDQQAKLVQDLRKVVTALGCGDLDYGIFTGTKEALDRGVVTIIYDGPNKKPLAFNSMAMMPCQLRGQPISVLHLGLTIVDPEYQSKGFTWTLYGLSTILLLIKNRLKPIWTSNVTQVPTVLGKVSENFTEVFPNPKTNQRRTFDHLTLARQIMEYHRDVFGVGPEATFDEDRFVIENSYTGGSDHLKKKFEDCTMHRVPIYNDYCKQELNYERGDDFLQLGKTDLQTVFQYVFRSLPANFLMTFLAKALLVSLNSFIAPVIQWYDTSKPFNELRARK